jgi:hypothetical protein
MADTYGNADFDKRLADTNIANDKARGKPPTTADLQKRGDAITRMADQRKPPEKSKNDPSNRKGKKR